MNRKTKGEDFDIMFEMSRTVNCSNIGEDGKARNSAIVDFLQDSSIFHLDSHPVMSPFFREENCVMFLVSRQIDIARRPFYGEKIKIRTWTYELKRMYGYRNTIIYSENGEPLVKSIASGAFMDNVSQRPRKVPQELVDRVKLYPKEDMEYLPRKITLPDSEPEVFPPLHIMKCYIDMNHHVNNARYIDIADEYLPENADISRMRIEYKMPLKRADTAIPRVFSEDGAVTVDISDENGKSFCIVEYTLK
ncbi:acyl-ACP thioesterase domain-containing protein [Ruminococcus sp. Marseille-P6503]|uniref:acyl-[acyl-carrier-protein] thioesterase n=1 Tax=Ruminococcus sp. Marseille-P6503 TaxID=2364796 RepID=UPI001FA9C422|nr:acyl-ACP thioesterase domain-containing protein [Ruminococcus sp. Marseille-P6503]